MAGEAGSIGEDPFGEERDMPIAILCMPDHGHVRRADDRMSVPAVGCIEAGDVEEPGFVLEIEEDHSFAARRRGETKAYRVSDDNRFTTVWQSACLTGREPAAALDAITLECHQITFDVETEYRTFSNRLFGR